MSMYTELKDNNLMKDFLEPNDDKYILVMYGRGNCGNCKKLKPRFEARGDGSLGDDILFIYNDVDKYKENIFVDELDVIPHFALFKGMKFIGESIGSDKDYMELLNLI